MKATTCTVLGLRTWVLIAAVAAFAAGPAMAEVLIQIETAELNYKPGDGVEVNVYGTSDEGPIVGFGFDLVGTEALNFESFEVASGFTAIASRDGDGIAGLSFRGGADGQRFLLGTAFYTAVLPASVQIDLATTAGDLTEGFARLGRGFFDFVAESNAFVIQGPAAPSAPSSGGGTTPVVPEPATFALMMVGLVGTQLRRRR